MKKTILILLLIVLCGAYSSRTEAAPSLESGTTWRQLAYGTLGMTCGGLSGVVLGSAAAETVNELSGEYQELFFIRYGLGYLVATELGTRGIELGYRRKNDKLYWRSMWTTRTVAGLGIPIAMVSGAIGVLGIAMKPGLDPPEFGSTDLVLLSAIPLVCLTLPSILGPIVYNKSRKLEPIEARVNILKVAF